MEEDVILSNREWHAADGASADALSDLRDAAQVPLPARYLDLLAFSNGGEGPLPVQPFNFCLYSAEEAAQIEREGTFKECFPGLFVIGGDGCGEAVALDLRAAEPWPVVAFDMTNIDPDESVRPIAPDFDAFVGLIGVSADE